MSSNNNENNNNNNNGGRGRFGGRGRGGRGRGRGNGSGYSSYGVSNGHLSKHHTKHFEGDCIELKGITIDLNQGGDVFDKHMKK